MRGLLARRVFSPNIFQEFVRRADGRLFGAFGQQGQFTEQLFENLELFDLIPRRTAASVIGDEQPQSEQELFQFRVEPHGVNPVKDAPFAVFRPTERDLCVVGHGSVHRVPGIGLHAQARARGDFFQADETVQPLGRRADLARPVRHIQRLAVRKYQMFHAVRIALQPERTGQVGQRTFEIRVNKISAPFITLADGAEIPVFRVCNGERRAGKNDERFVYIRQTFYF